MCLKKLARNKFIKRPTFTKMATINIPGIKVNEQNAKGKFPMKKLLPQMYFLCRVKANQVSLFKRRGYIVAKLPKESEDSYRNRLTEEQEWLECSQDDEKLLAKTKQLMFSKSTNEVVKELLNRDYEITIKKWLTAQECAKMNARMLPIIDDNEFSVGLFRNEGDSYIELQNIHMYEELKRTTKVIFGDDQHSSNVVYTDTPHYFAIALNAKPDIQAKINLRNQGVELWHAEELLIDPFQHWLTPFHRKVDTPELIHLISDIAVMKDGKKWSVVKNSTITGKDNLPILLETDIAVRFIGANTGDVIYWENPSIIEQLSATEFGYCRIKGHTIELMAEEGQEDEDLDQEEEEEEDEEDLEDQEDD